MIPTIWNEEEVLLIRRITHDTVTPLTAVSGKNGDMDFVMVRRTKWRRPYLRKAARPVYVS